MTYVRPLLDDAEIVVVGGGPAGSIAAFTLATGGHDVLIVDKHTFPREKACGDGLTWSAVSFLRELGLGDILDDALRVEAFRLCVDWREQELARMRTRRGGAWNQPCCLPRARLDEALLDAACAAGARLIKGYVRYSLPREGGVTAVELDHEGARRTITGRHVVVADGATSLLRRQVTGPSETAPASSYALRRYVRSDRPLDPICDIYLPLPDPYVGYGWVFPVSERVANVGLGYVSARGLPRPRPITDMLESFIASLGQHRGAELGSLTPLGPARGAPVAMGFAPDRCQVGGLLFAGDAARTCDPITGEGIDQAMRSAHSAALALHRAIQRGAAPRRIGYSIARSNPRLGQDSAMFARLGYELLARRKPGNADAADPLRAPAPLFSAARSMLTAEVDRPMLAHTPAGQVASRLGLARFIEELEDRIREEVRSEFVLASELVYRDVCAGLGPAGALVLAAVHATLSPASGDLHLDGALAVELLRVFPTMLGRITSAPDHQARTSNALTVMVADHCLSRAIAAAARMTPGFSGMLAEPIESSSEAAALLERDRFNLHRSPSRYLEWAALSTGASLSVAAGMGARLAGAEDDIVNGLEAFGESLGIALQICEDHLALARVDPATGSRPWRMLQEGDFRLPVILAIQRDPSIRSRLLGMRGPRGWDIAVRALADAQGLAEAQQICEQYAQDARALAVALSGEDSSLVKLCELPVECLVTLASSRPVKQVPAEHSVSSLSLAS